MQFLPSGTGFVSASEDKTARLFDLRSDQQVFVFRPPTTNSGLTSCAVSPSGRALFAGSDDSTIHIWDVLKGEHNGKIARKFQRNSLVNFMKIGR